MRCIEMISELLITFIPQWLIETWDVLKYDAVGRGFEQLTINRNMRCIEIPTAGQTGSRLKD